MSRTAIVAQLSAALKGRDLIWAGTRGSDAVAFHVLDAFAASWTVLDSVAPESGAAISLEELSGVRVDLDLFDIDSLDVRSSGPGKEFLAALERLLERPCVVTGYRPSQLLSSALLRHPLTATAAMPASVHQSAFEFKPWVESELAKAGVRGLGWIYDKPGSFEVARQLLDRGPVMLRAARTSGGVGFTAVRDQADLVELEAQAGKASDALTAVAPLLEGLVPVNVAAVIYQDDVRLHPASVQMIGIPGATMRPFGYCGNDFVATGDLSRKAMESLGATTVAVGWWLHHHGLRGAFGVDFLVDGNDVHFTEVNPRLQGSSALSSRIAAEADQSCIVLEHVAASLGLPPCGPSRSLSWWAGHSTYAQLVIHAPGRGQQRLAPEVRVEELIRAGVVASADSCTSTRLLTDEGAVVCRLVVGAQITTSGFRLLPGHDQLLQGWQWGGVQP